MEVLLEMRVKCVKCIDFLLLNGMKDVGDAFSLVVCCLSDDVQVGGAGCGRCQ
jgi:hypothetical protein